MSNNELKLLVSTLCVLVAANFSSQASAVSDPTKPYSYQSVKKTKPIYKLNSVLISDVRRIAVINGKAYAEGEQLPLGTLAKITADHVIINGKSRHILKLGTRPIRQQSN